jgi:hypothetical protein
VIADLVAEGRQQVLCEVRRAQRGHRQTGLLHHPLHAPVRERRVHPHHGQDHHPAHPDPGCRLDERTQRRCDVADRRWAQQEQPVNTHEGRRGRRAIPHPVTPLRRTPGAATSLDVAREQAPWRWNAS